MLLQIPAFLAVLFFAVLAAGIAYQKHGLRKDRRNLPPPGRLVAVGGRRLHINELGSGQPTVVFESGLASSSVSWTLVQTIVGQVTRTISYDRAGIGWSEEVVQPRTATSMVDDLQTLLSASDNPPPYVLVGHSFGGLIARAYASLRREDVAGLVLVDPVSLELWADCGPEHEKRLRLGARLSTRGILLANVGVVRLALATLASGRTRFAKAVGKASAAKAMGTMGRLTAMVGKLPASMRPAVQSHWSQAKSFRTLAGYLKALPQCAKEANAMAVSTDLPVTILSAANATAEEIAEREIWAKASIRGRHLQIVDSGHWIQLEQPQQVAGAVIELLEHLRNPARIGRSA